MTRKIEAHAGEHISKAAQRAVDLVAGEPSVSFAFNEITLTVIRGMSAADVCAEYDRRSEERHAAYVASPKYKERQRQAEERERERVRKLDTALLEAPAAMTLKDAEAWEKWRANNTDGYGAACVRYAELWARTMEGMIAGGVTLADCAEEASHIADSEGFTGFMYGAAVSMLSTVWIHGEALRRWHNKETQLGDEGDRANATGGVLNPVLLSIGEKR